MLPQAGLGRKKIKFLEDDTDEDVLNKLTSDAKDEFGNISGFPQLRTSGGFEMFQCLANSKNISVSGTLVLLRPSISFGWASKNLSEVHTEKSQHQV